MKINNVSIGTRLAVGFGLMTAITALTGLLAIFQAYQLSGLTDALYDHPYTVTNSMRDIRGNIRMVETALADMLVDPSPAKIDHMRYEILDAQKNIRQLFAIVNERFLGNKADVAAAEDVFNEWVVLLDKALAAQRDNLSDAAKKAAIQEARALTTRLVRKSQVMIDFATNKAVEFNDEAAKQGQRATIVLIVIVAAACLAGLVVSRFISNSITVPLSAMIARVKGVARGGIGQDLDYYSEDEVGDLADSFRLMRKNLLSKVRIAEAVAAGDYSVSVDTVGDEDVLGKSLAIMTKSLKDAADANTRTDWIKSGRNKLNAVIAGENDLRSLCSNVISFLAGYMNAQIGAVYALSSDGRLVLAGSYAFTKRKDLADSYALGEGIVGQAALEKSMISLSNIPDDYIRIKSSLGDAHPRNIVVLPLLHVGELKGVIELGSLEEFSDTKLELLQAVSETMGVALQSVDSQDKLRALLEQTRLQADKLQAQQEELRVSNEELEQQSSALRSSEEELRQQQEELQSINEELEEKNHFLELQRAEMGIKNTELNNIRKGLEIKARELELTTRYKSEFLANMSHELRTPLNSLLLLSRSLMENSSGNLNEAQVEYSRIIHRSGNDLLSLINEILDLSKIEAGKMTITPEDVPVLSLVEAMAASFKPLAEEKQLALTFHVDERIPAVIQTDRQRIEQVLRNLLSNAIKFSDQGSVSLSLRPPTPEECVNLDGLSEANALAVAVTDTGVGIAAEKQQEIFEAFRQVDGGTDRKYGGTGLGLTISRELAKLLHGALRLQSSPGQGSTFTLVIPQRLDQGSADQPLDATTGPAQGGGEPPIPVQAKFMACTAAAQPKHLADDRNGASAGPGYILIIEDDPAFARILMDQCRSKGFGVLHAASGEEGIELARKYAVGGIVLDIRLPGMNGWQVLEEFKQDPELRHIPVHIMSAEEATLDAQKKGAVGFLAKPASRENLDEALERLEGFMSKKVKDLLVVEDNQDMRKGVLSLLGDANIRIQEADTGVRALEAMRQCRFDCVILDLGLPDMTGFELLNLIEQDKNLHIPPIIVYTGRELTREEEQALHGHAESIIIKGVKSEERLIDETALFLHQVVKAMPVKKRELIATLYDKDKALRDKVILLVDDDMRNLYALSHVLQEKGLNVLKAEDGEKALEMLEARQDVSLVLLDIMMPVMDGYETLARIRANPRLSRLPVIALTAKAMLEDKERCIAAGASDYLSKPVDLDRLLSKLRVWLYNQESGSRRT
ncbi:response regulator [Fundidesulfovibrio putealis]|uniref:response regulator n=1 Tax=Fundidesulfovibrio putealis TaxID=270496 RepID=UPI000427A791|nr:response regulator [Fundidesulfovibrio putealis]